MGTVEFVRQVGDGKSLVFALIVAMIGCFQGFRTRGSADSVGRQTTLSVVQSIFLVIVADALLNCNTPLRTFVAPV